MSCKWHYSVILWLSNSLLYICDPSSLPTHLLMDIYVASIPRRGPSSWTILPGECRRFCYICPDENIHHHPVLASSTRRADLSPVRCMSAGLWRAELQVANHRQWAWSQASEAHSEPLYSQSCEYLFKNFEQQQDDGKVINRKLRSGLDPDNQDYRPFL